jgi:hypothetical protein
MPTYTALTTLPGKAPAEALGEALESLSPEPTGVGVFEIEDDSGLWEVGAYFTEAPDEAGLALLATIHGAKDFTVSELPETDWVAHVKRELAPVVAGRFFVYGSHDADKVPADKVPLLIEAAMAFGTGHHGTTQGCLRAIDRLAGEGGRAGVGRGHRLRHRGARHGGRPDLAGDAGGGRHRPGRGRGGRGEPRRERHGRPGAMCRGDGLRPSGARRGRAL